VLRVVRMHAEVNDLIHEYGRRYTAHDADAVTALCLAPFLAIREGRPIHLSDREAVRDHFQAMMDAYRGAGGRHLDAGRDRHPHARGARGVRDRSLERARHHWDGAPGYEDDVPRVVRSQRLALPVVHEPLLSPSVQIGASA